MCYERVIMKTLIFLVSLMALNTQASSTSIKDVPTVSLKGEVGGQMPFLAKQVLRLANMSKEIAIIIDSPGGDVITGIYFMNAMKLAQGKGVKFKCIVTGEAASIAFHILALCDERYALPYSFLMFHRMSVIIQDRLMGVDLQRILVMMNSLEKTLDRQLRETLGVSKEQYIKHRNSETLFIGQDFEAFAPGFLQVVDQIEGVKDLSTLF